MDFAAMKGYVVANRYVVADFDGRFLIERVEYGTILDVYAVADADRVYVAAQYGVEPYGTFIAHLYIADNRSVFGQEAVFPDFGSESP